ncbi:hypothetical protein WN982_19525 [Paraburkholderia sp. IMGN_8]|uniref:hypothetical protein n=1 Tax=Paraburkholderia sp. IMGN_8 TaxID=3136564 RepID=UPI003100EE86
MRLFIFKTMSPSSGLPGLTIEVTASDADPIWLARVRTVSILPASGISQRAGCKCRLWRQHIKPKRLSEPNIESSFRPLTPGVNKAGSPVRMAAQKLLSPSAWSLQLWLRQPEVAIMSFVQGFVNSMPTRGSSLVAVAAISVAVVCGTGIAAFVGLLPASGDVAAAVTVTPLIDMQVDAYVKRVATMH